jgi:hypothetical protein
MLTDFLFKWKHLPIWAGAILARIVTVLWCIKVVASHSEKQREIYSQNKNGPESPVAAAPSGPYCHGMKRHF